MTNTEKTPKEKASPYIQHLTFTYGKYFNMWDGKAKDDRQVFCNIFRSLVEAYAQLEESSISSSVIWVALNNYRKEEVKTLDGILESYKAGIFNAECQG